MEQKKSFQFVKVTGLWTKSNDADYEKSRIIGMMLVMGFDKVDGGAFMDSMFISAEQIHYDDGASSYSSDIINPIDVFDDNGVPFLDPKAIYQIG